ncbi:hypothetical protein BURPS1710b_A1973 [Burkholderia pseudomallei 1710b]|uniref:Uncharacterized protein n=1 Tax=Burkholderia pseudomallei (strain 1710b) TaxID=320372 RepID=Q3JH29_BURP1|nr:hypothetical protein BURPS1710b_A1973 [Burkholderia pseudomallei 1710b]
MAPRADAGGKRASHPGHERRRTRTSADEHGRTRTNADERGRTRAAIRLHASPPARFHLRSRACALAYGDDVSSRIIRPSVCCLSPHAPYGDSSAFRSTRATTRTCAFASRRGKLE